MVANTGLIPLKRIDDFRDEQNYLRSPIFYYVHKSNNSIHNSDTSLSFSSAFIHVQPQKDRSSPVP